MTAAIAPSRRIGIAGTTLAHGGLIVLALVAARQSRIHTPRTYEVTLVAAPLRAPGTATTATVAPKEIAPVIKPKPAKTPAKKVPLQAKANPAPVTKQLVTPVQTAQPSTGTDVVSVHQDGIAFPDKAYLANIENAIFRNWQHEAYRPGLNVKIEFVILRDGSVDPKSIKVTKRSVSSSFDFDAQTAIEVAANSKAFGALPSSWNGASLPILFDFTQAGKGTP